MIEGWDVDQSFEALLSGETPESFPATSATSQEFDQAAVRELFAQIAANHARPIKNLIFELKRGTASKEWIDVCRPVMVTLIEGAESTGLTQAATRMIDFREALSLAAGGTGPFIEADAQELILSAYQEMAEALPEAFLQGEEESRRETIIIHSLLKQIPDVGHVTFQRLYGAGLTTLEAMFLANEAELAQATGISAVICARICERIQDYRRQLEREKGASYQEELHERLRALVVDLRREHDGFQRTSTEEWTSPGLADKKRVHRQNRKICALQIDVLLADMGELELGEKTGKMPFELRIETLEEFVARVGVTAAGTRE